MGVLGRAAPSVLANARCDLGLTYTNEPPDLPGEAVHVQLVDVVARVRILHARPDPSCQQQHYGHGHGQDASNLTFIIVGPLLVDGRRLPFFGDLELHELCSPLPRNPRPPPLLQGNVLGKLHRQGTFCGSLDLGNSNEAQRLREETPLGRGDAQGLDHLGGRSAAHRRPSGH